MIWRGGIQLWLAAQRHSGRGRAKAAQPSVQLDVRHEAGARELTARYTAMNTLCRCFSLLLLVVALSGCDRFRPLTGAARSYGDCLASRLSSAHTTEAGVAIIAACRSEFPPGIDLRRRQTRLPGIHVNGRAGLDESYGHARTFSGTLWNGSSAHVVTEVKLRIKLKPKQDAKTDKKSEGSSWLYSVPLELLPQTAAQFSIPIVPVSDSDFEWGVAEIYGVPVVSAR